MNTTTTDAVPSRIAQTASSPVDAGDDEIRLSEYLDILLDRKWLVAAITALALMGGVGYALLSTPVYQSNLVVQVEDATPLAKGVLGEVSNLFDVKTPASGEIQVLRSRLVLDAAVEQTRYYIQAEPRYLPFVGRWLARRATALSTPGFLGMGGYVTGKERIHVGRFDVPESLEDAGPFVLTAQGDGRYSVHHDQMAEALSGTVGTLLEIDTGAGPVQLMVDRLDGLPGAQFVVGRASLLRTVESLQKRVQLAEQGRQSNVIAATLEDSDRVGLVGILNAIGEQYVRQNVERKAAEAEKTLAFLDKQLPELRSDLEASEDAFTRFRNKNGTIAFDEEARGILQHSIEVQTKLLEAQQQRREMATRFTDANTRVRTLDQLIAALQKELGEMNSRVSRMPAIQQDALRLERDVRVNAELYQSLRNNALQLRLVKEGKVGNVRVLDKAVMPKQPIKPQKPLIVALSFLLGLLAGSGLAIVLARISRGIRDPQEIEAYTGLDVYAAIPFAVDQAACDQKMRAGARGVHVLAESKAESPAIESLRSLRVALQIATMEASNNCILVTGATPGIGKSFVSANFAAIMAQAGKRVLLIDADLRKGHLNKAFGLPRPGGLVELLTGELTAAQAIHADVVPNLSVLTTGALPSNPANVMMSEAFARTLKALSANYDLVVADTPPVLVAADTPAVAAHFGVVLLVARADKTLMGELSESAKRLRHARSNVHGVVFNGMDLSRRHYGSYGYRYGGYRYAEYKYSK